MISIAILTVALAASPTNVEMEQWIAKLGSAKYKDRQEAVEMVKKLDHHAADLLKKHAASDPDPEVKSMSRYLIGVLREVFPSPDKKGKSRHIPEIWLMPNKIRFQNSVDIADKYYKENHRLMKCIEKGVSPQHRTRSNDYVSYWENYPCIPATLQWIGDLREKGMPKKDAVKLLDEMIQNEKDMCYFWQTNKAPTPLILRSYFKEHEEELKKKYKTYYGPTSVKFPVLFE